MEIKEEGGMFGLTATTATTEATTTTTTTAPPAAAAAAATRTAAEQLVMAVPVPTRKEDAIHQQSNNPQEVNHVAATRKQPLSVNSAAANDNDTTHGNSRVVLDNKNNDDNNESLQAAKAATVERGTDIIRHHLEHHLEHNPRSSFVTWIATLHPENASVVIDDRFLIPGNPWLSVYEDAIQQQRQRQQLQRQQQQQQQQRRGKKHSNDNDNGRVPSATTTTTTANGGPHDEQDKEDKNMVYQASFLDTIVSWTLTAAAACITVSLELVAMYFLVSIWICTNLTTNHQTNSARAWFGPPLGILTFLPFGICQVLRGVFTCLNAIVLCLSIGLVELLAAVNLMLGTLFSCHAKVGWEHHQQTRRTCHLIRWAFRKRFFENVPVDHSSSSSSLSPSSGRGSDENAALREQLC